MSELPTKPIKITRLVPSNFCVFAFGELETGITFVGPFSIAEGQADKWAKELGLSNYQIIYIDRPDVYFIDEKYNPDLGE